MLPLLFSLLLLPLALGDQGAGPTSHHTSHHTSSSHHAPASHHAPHHAPLSSIQATAPYTQPAVSLPLESQGGEYTYPTPGQYPQASSNYAPSTDSAFGYSYDYPLDQENEVDSVSDKQGITNPAAFIPLITSLSLPLGAAVLTFVALVSVAAAFLLFPQMVEVEVNGRGSRVVRSVQDNSLDMAMGLCAHSSSTVCKLLNAVLISKDCLEAASCEVASMTNSKNFPVMANIVKPFMSQKYYKRFETVDCTSLQCDLRKFY